MSVASHPLASSREVLPDTFTAVWRRAVAENAANTFLVFRDDCGTTTHWTYGEFDAVVARVAGTLRSAGVEAGSCVHLVLRNSPAFVALWLAAARLGAWMTPVDPASGARDISNQVRRTMPSVAVIASSRAAAYSEGAAGRVAAVLEIQEDASDLALNSLLTSGLAIASPELVQPLDRLAVMFTSGTTSEPKAVELTQGCYATVAARMAAPPVDLLPQHRWFVTLPLFHANAQYYCFAPAIWVGASVALTATFSASRWVQQAGELAVTHTSLFAAPIRMILARCSLDAKPLAMEHVWFAQSLGADHHRAFGALTGTLPRQLYGMTETVAMVAFDRSEPAVPDSIGPAAPGRVVKVVDQVSGAETEVGQPGELLVLGTRGIDLFAGYLDADEINAKVFESDGDGTWFRTGDLVVRDSQNAMRFVGRVDDVIKVSGENVSLTEVEAIVAQAPGVLEAAIISQPDAVRDHVLVAYYVAKDPSNPPVIEDLERWAEQNLGSAARPRAWHLINELPRTSVGKLRRFRVGR
jgi:crotonobetaine/carnitine-CoA ligase